MLQDWRQKHVYKSSEGYNTCQEVNSSFSAAQSEQEQAASWHFENFVNVPKRPRREKLSHWIDRTRHTMVIASSYDDGVSKALLCIAYGHIKI